MERTLQECVSFDNQGRIWYTKWSNGNEFFVFMKNPDEYVLCEYEGFEEGDGGMIVAKFKQRKRLPGLPRVGDKLEL